VESDSFEEAHQACPIDNIPRVGHFDHMLQFVPQRRDLVDPSKAEIDSDEQHPVTTHLGLPAPVARFVNKEQIDQQVRVLDSRHQITDEARASERFLQEPG
jgi:hypothetical protein